jgi:hypothetical protein
MRNGTSMPMVGRQARWSTPSCPRRICGMATSAQPSRKATLDRNCTPMRHTRISTPVQRSQRTNRSSSTARFRCPARIWPPRRSSRSTASEHDAYVGEPLQLARYRSHQRCPVEGRWSVDLNISQKNHFFGRYPVERNKIKTITTYQRTVIRCL